MKNLNLFAEEDRLEKLSKLGDPLEKLNESINWDVFKGPIKEALSREAKGLGGRPAYDSVLMFKILVLQRLYNISDDQAEYQINDRMSFRRFLGLHSEDSVPDAKTIWHYRDELVKAEIVETLFRLFTKALEDRGLITRTGTIVDATFVDAPRQRNTREENKIIKEGGVPDAWKKPEHHHKRVQKDVEARWTKKRNETHYGYKDHVKVDAQSKLITDYRVTAANVHDSQEFLGFIDEGDQNIYADSAYSGAPIASKLPAHVKNRIHEKGYKKHPLTEEQKAGNREKSRIRCRIEHVFGYITGSMNGLTVRCIGQARAAFNIGLTNLIYNLCRYGALKRLCLGVG
jgi:IS5 family transposase